MAYKKEEMIWMGVDFFIFCYMNSNTVFYMVNIFFRSNT